MLRWPSLRFEKFYESFQRRKVIEELTLRKITMAAAIYANSNWDGKDNAGKRQEFIQGLEEQFMVQLGELYNPGRAKREKEIMQRDPFFEAMERGLAKQGVPTLEELD